MFAESIEFKGRKGYRDNIASDIDLLNCGAMIVYVVIGVSQANYRSLNSLYIDIL